MKPKPVYIVYPSYSVFSVIAFFDKSDAKKWATAAKAEVFKYIPAKELKKDKP